jgi:two-component sensor histidine kinase
MNLTAIFRGNAGKITIFNEIIRLTSILAVMKRPLLITIGAFALLPLKGQTDSLRVKSLLQAAASFLREETSSKIPAYFPTPPNEKDLDSACYYLKKASTLSDSLHQDAYTNEILCLLGKVYMRKENPKEARRYFMQAIANTRASGDREAEAHIWLRWAGGRESWKETNYPDIIAALQQAKSLFGQTGDNEQLAQTLLSIGFFYILQGEMNQAELTYLKAVELYQAAGNRKLDPTYVVLSNINRYKGDFNRALLFALKAKKSMEETGNTASADNVYGELALVYQELGQSDESIEWYKKTIKIREEAHAPQIVIYRTTGLLVQELLKEGKTREGLAAVLEMRKKSPPVGKLESASISQISAYCYEALKDYRLAERSYLEMIKLYEQNRWNDELTNIAFFDIGKFYINRQQFDKGEYYLRKVLKTTPGANLLSRVRDGHQMLFKVDSANRRYLSAIRHYQLFKTLNDSLFNDTKSKQIEELQIQYRTEAKDKDILLKQQNIQLLTKQSQLQQGQLKDADLMRNVTLCGIAVSIIIAGLSFSRYRIKQKANKVLLSQKEEIRSKNSSLEHLVSEKEWLLREIHHRVKNNLQIIMSLLNSQSSYLNDGPALAAIRSSQQRVHSISLIHNKLYQTENLSIIDMQVYIRELVEYLRDSLSTGHKIIFNLNVDPLELGVYLAVPLGLILNEAITNAIKYAFPGDRTGIIWIGLHQEESCLYSLSITDNGIGISSTLIDKGGGSLGITLMKGLTEEIAGSFSLDQDGGTKVHVSFMTNTEIKE